MLRIEYTSIRTVMTVRALAELTGLPLADCSELVDAIYKRRPALKWTPGISAILTFLGWMFAFGRVTDALEGTSWDVLALLRQLGVLGVLGALMLGYGIAITLALVVGTIIPRAILRRQLLHHLYSPACFWCGYSLCGLQRRNAAIHCPECGQLSPVRYKDEYPRP